MIFTSRKQKIKQIAAGLALIACSIVPIIIENDATIAVLTVPLGVALIFTREKVVD